MTPVTTKASVVSYVANGRTRNFPFHFRYLDRTHLTVEVFGLPVAFTLVGTNTARLNFTPVNGAPVVIRRETPSEPGVKIPDGGVITDEILQGMADHPRFIAEEARDAAGDFLRFNDALGAYDARGYRITNVGMPIRLADAVTKQALVVEVARYVGGDALAELMAQVVGWAALIETSLDELDGLVADFNEGLDIAEALRDQAAAGPSGEEIVARITAYLGTDAWINNADGQDPSGTLAGAHRYWRIAFTTRAGGSTSFGAFRVSDIQFREEIGEAETHIIMDGATPVGNNCTADVRLPDGNQWPLWYYAFDDLGTSTELFYNLSLSPGAPGYAYVTFDVSREVYQIAMTAPATGPGSFVVQYSDNGTSWTTAATFESLSWSGSEQTFLLPTFAVSNRTVDFDVSGTFDKPTFGRVAYIQIWGAGGSDCGGGGGYREAYIPINMLASSTAVTVGTSAPDQNGGSSSFGSITAYGGKRGTGSIGGDGGGPFSTTVTGEGRGGFNNSDQKAGGGVYYGGGGNSDGPGGSSIYGGGGGGTSAPGQSAHGGRGGSNSLSPLVPGGGGGPDAAGASGRVRISVLG